MSGSQIIDITYNSTDYSKKLLAHNFGSLIFLNHQIELVREQRKEALSKQFHKTELLANLDRKRIPINTQPFPFNSQPHQPYNNIPYHYHSHGGNQQSNYRTPRAIVSTNQIAYVPKATILSPPMSTMLRSPQKMSPQKSPLQSISTFKSNTLRIGTSHEVYCSFIEDGPLLFSIQLANEEELLMNMMATLEQIELHNLIDKPSLGV